MINIQLCAHNLARDLDIDVDIALTKFYDQKTQEIDFTQSCELLAEICVSLATTDPKYSLLAGRLLLETLTEVKETFVENVNNIADNVNLLDCEFVKIANQHKDFFNNLIDVSKDLTYDFFSLKTLFKTHLLSHKNSQNRDIIAETPHDYFDYTLTQKQKDLAASNVQIFKDMLSNSSRGMRHNNNKIKLSLLDFSALEQAAKVLQFGGKKYSRDNWKKGFEHSEIVDSLLRHISEYQKGNEVDSESKLLHTAHILCNAMFLCYMNVHKPELNDFSLKK